VAFLLDTNVAIHLRDGDPMVRQKVAALNGAALISVVTALSRRASIGNGARAYSQAAARRHAERHSNVNLR
jgi:predicted nucleic acid-binding protein